MAVDKKAKAEKPVETAEKKVADAGAKKEKAKDGAKVPQKPEDAAYNARIAEIDAKIDGKKTEMQKLQVVINQRSVGKEAYEEQRTALYDQMTAIKTERSALAEQRKALRDNEKQLKEKARSAERGLKDLLRSSESMNEEALTDKIAGIEYKLSISTMSLKEEKAMLQEMKKLRALKPQAQKITRELETARAAAASGEHSTDATTVGEQMTNLTERINKLEGESQVAWEKIQALKEERKKQTSGVEKELEKKDKLKNEIDVFWAEKKGIFGELKAAKDAYFQFQRAEREAKSKRWEAERAKQDAEWESERAKSELEKPNPFLSEVTIVAQTLDWCKIQLGEKDEVAEAEKKDLDHVNPEGSKILISKKDRDMDMYIVPKGKKLRKKGGDKVKSSAIKHTADTFQVFEELKLTPPTSTEQIPALQEKLEKMLADVNKKIADWEEERKKKVEEMKLQIEAATVAEEEAAAASPVASPVAEKKE